MSNKPITVRILLGLYSQLEEYVVYYGSSKTDLLIAALTSYLKSSDELPFVESNART